MLSQLGCVDVLGMPNCALYRIPTARYSRVFAVARVHTRHVRTHRFRLAYLREGMENMRASPLEYVSMGPLYHHASPVLLARLASIRFHHPPIPTSLRLPLPPLYTGYNAIQPYITRRPSLSFSLRVCSLPLDRRSCVACVCVDTARGGENENSSRVRMLASGIQLERAIGPNGMKFLCGQTQERSRASFFSLAQPELPPIRTIFVQPESRVIEMASLFLRAYPERNEISLGECSFCSISHVERIDGISFFSGAGSSSFDLISNREGSEPPPPLTSFPGFTPEIFSIQLFPLCFLLSLSLTLFTVPPDILSSGTSEGEVSVLEGENATLSCKATGRPAPRVLWRREKSGSILMRGLHDPLIPGKILHFYLESSTLASVVPGDK